MRRFKSTNPSFFFRFTRAKPIYYLVLLILLVALSLLVFFPRQRQETHPRAAASAVPASPSADLSTKVNTTGHIVYASPSAGLSSKVDSLKAGDTLILSDGVYSNQGLLAQGLHGSASSPITIRAEHDGKAIIDAGGGANAVYIASSSYVVLEEIVARNTSSDVIFLTNCDHITLRRVTAYNAGSRNWHVFDIEKGSSNILVEDCAGWGRGRYIFVAYQNVTFRRTWARWTTQSDFSPAPRSCYSVYGTSNAILENAICFNDLPDQSSTDYFTAMWETSDGPATDNTKYLGVMFFNNWEGLWVNESAGENTQIVNSYFENTRAQGNFTTDKDHGDGLTWQTPNGGSITTSTFVNNEVGYDRRDGSPTISNSVFLKNDTAINGDQGHSYLDFWQNGSIGTNVSSTDKQVDPGYDVTKYGRGAYLFVPPNSPLKHAGQGGSDIGANIIYRYQDGVLTNQPLWPWPMEDRIKAETGYSVTWESGGGLWKTLDGVYANRVSLSEPASPSDNPMFSSTLSFSMSNPPLPTTDNNSSYSTRTLYCLNASQMIMRYMLLARQSGRPGQQGYRYDEADQRESGRARENAPWHQRGGDRSSADYDCAQRCGVKRAKATRYDWPPGS